MVETKFNVEELYGAFDLHKRVVVVKEKVNWLIAKLTSNEEKMRKLVELAGCEKESHQREVKLKEKELLWTDYLEIEEYQ